MDTTSFSAVRWDSQRRQTVPLERAPIPGDYVGTLQWERARWLDLQKDLLRHRTLPNCIVPTKETGRMLANSMKCVKKQHLPEKPCATCGRPFTWRKKWERVWDEVRFCSDRCRMRKASAKGS